MLKTIFNSIAFKVFLLFLILMGIIIISMNYITYDNTIKIIENEQKENYFKLLDETENILTLYVKNIQSLIGTMAEKETIRNYNIKNRDIISNELSFFYTSNIEYIDTIHFIGEDNYIITTNMITSMFLENQKSSDLYKNAVENPGGIYWTLPYENYFNDVLVSCSKAVCGYDGKLLGVLVIDINFRNIDRNISNGYSWKGNSFIIIDEGGIIVSSNSKDNKTEDIKKTLEKYSIDSNIFSELMLYERGYLEYKNLKKQKVMVYYSNYRKLGLKILNIVDYSIIKERLNFVRRKYILFGGIFFILIMIMAYFFAIYISKPIKKLTCEIEKVKNGNLSVKIPVQRKDEIGKLGEEFNNMIKRVEELIIKAVEHEREKKENDFKLLQAQINPHFLYNTLSSVNCLAGMRRFNEIQTMITSLINLLQSSINKMSEIITLRQEKENLKNYCNIQKLRYGGKFNIIYNMDENLMDFKIPKLVLQPIVENSIFHGIQPKSGIGTIRVSAIMIISRIILTIEDDGVGMDEKRIREVLLEDYSSEEGFTKVGIVNVNRRIKHYFGDEYGLSIESRLNQGCKVEISIPIEM